MLGYNSNIGLFRTNDENLFQIRNDSVLFLCYDFPVCFREGHVLTELGGSIFPDGSRGHVLYLLINFGSESCIHKQ